MAILLKPRFKVGDQVMVLGFVKNILINKTILVEFNNGSTILLTAGEIRHAPKNPHRRIAH